MIAAIVLAALTSVLPVHEEKIVKRVAADYALTDEQTALLAAIRRAENGRDAIAFGVADRRCRTYLEQARWAANTIRKRYNGDLVAFAKRWCPSNWWVWLKNVRWFMYKQGIYTIRKR